MPVFPSVEWFQAVRTAANADPAFRSLGTAEAQVGVKVGDDVYVLDFDAFECSGVSQVEEYYLVDVDFYLEMTSISKWPRKSGARCLPTSERTMEPTLNIPSTRWT